MEASPLVRASSPRATVFQPMVTLQGELDATSFAEPGALEGDPDNGKGFVSPTPMTG